MTRTCLYFRRQPERDRWLPGDRFIRPLVRRAVRGRPRPGGIDKVFINLRLGLDRLGIAHEVNLPFEQLRTGDRIGVLGCGRYSLHGYNRQFPVVAGIGLMTYPGEWPNLCEEYPVVRYLQHSAWVNDVYKPFFKDKCRIWPVGIDTHSWRPGPPTDKRCDFLLYDKILWRPAEPVPPLLRTVREELARRKLTFMEIRYGQYSEQQYREALARCRAMIFLCEHESQGLAYQECLACDVPILAWDQGRLLDPARHSWGVPDVGATSVPYFDARCGEKFTGIEQLATQLELFRERFSRGEFRPREYILETLTLERCARNFLTILEEAQGPN